MGRGRTAALRAGAVAAGIAVTVTAALALLNSPPAAFPRGRAAPKADGERLFVIEKGEPLARIAERLAEEGYIRSPLFLRLVSRILGTQGSFKAGWYRLPAGASTLNVHGLLVSGAQALEKVTIPEGWTMSQIARLLDQKGICQAADFLAVARSAEEAKTLGVPGRNLEGWLFPDTYFLPKPFPPGKAASVMVGAFFGELARVAPEYKELAPEALASKVILASMIERECRLPEEAPLIASVFYNRLARGIGLETDATLIYIITEIQGRPHPRYLTLEDKKIDSPYNTYKWAGLPPGPIASPGRTSLEAAFHPARTEYYYYVLQDPATGRHYFSKGLEEHIQAKRTYLKN